jgi:hypothetical protein
MEKLFFKTVLLTVIIFTNLNCCIEFYRNEVFVPARLGDVRLYKDCYGFHVFKDGQVYDIQNCFCDPLLREMSDEQLSNFLGRNKPKIILLTVEQFEQLIQGEEVELTDDQEDTLSRQLRGTGYVVVNQLDNGAYILRAKIRLLGGVRAEDIKLAKEGARKGAKVLACKVAVDSVITAASAAKVQMAAAACATSTGGTAVVVVPIVVAVIVVIAIGYAYITSPSQGGLPDETKPENKDEAETAAPAGDEEPPMIVPDWE